MDSRRGGGAVCPGTAGGSARDVKSRKCRTCRGSLDKERLTKDKGKGARQPRCRQCSSHDADTRTGRSEQEQGLWGHPLSAEICARSQLTEHVRRAEALVEIVLRTGLNSGSPYSGSWGCLYKYCTRRGRSFVPCAASGTWRPVPVLARGCVSMPSGVSDRI